VFGELFGGVYPHPEVEDLGHQPVQKGVFYTPDLDFYAFDIQVVRPAATATATARDDDGEGEGEGGVVKSWLDYDRATKLFAASGLFYARPLVEGTLAECFAYDIRINSTLPGLLGLPPLEQNQIEGIVIKSVHNVGLAMGKRYQGGSGGGPRAIFKKKNARFEEVNPKCETKWEEQRRVKKAAIDTVYDEVERYITINRLHNLESKMGPVTRDNASEAATALAADAMKDLVRDYEETWAVIEEAAREVVHKNVRSKAAQWLNDHLAATSDV
jgi:Rnl2 family RNA ligase